MTDQPIRIPCQVCHESCIKNPESGKWFHEEDYLSLNDVTAQKYNHEAVPFIVEIDPTSVKEIHAEGKAFPDLPKSLG
jgi:hypothetical protein